MARRSSLPSSGVPQRSSKSASSQLLSGKDNRDVKRRYFYAAWLLKKRRDLRPMSSVERPGRGGRGVVTLSKRGPLGKGSRDKG